MTSQVAVIWAGGVGGGEDSGDDGIVGADDGASDPVPHQDVVSRTAPIRAAAPRNRHLDAGLAAALMEWVTTLMLAPLRFDVWSAVGAPDLRVVGVSFNESLVKHQSLCSRLVWCPMVSGPHVARRFG